MQVKLCVNCKHFARGTGFMSNDECNSPEFIKVDPIYGHTIKINIYTARARCDGYYFEPKEEQTHDYEVDQRSVFRMLNI